MIRYDLSSSERTDATSEVLAQPRWAGLRRNWPKLFGLAIWLTLLAAYWQYTRSNGITPLESVQRLVEFMASSGAGVLVYSLAYMGRPVLFFPATLLTLAGGYLYGPALGVTVVVASNLSSLVAYNIGRFFGAPHFHEAEPL